MKMGKDIHNFEKRLENSLNNLKKSKISEQDKETILEFHRNCFAERLSLARIERYVYLLGRIAKSLPKGLCNSKKEDIMAFVGMLERSKYKEWTKQLFRVSLKKFYKWLRKTEEYPEEVKWLKCTVKNGHHKLPEELLTVEEVKRLVDAANNPRDKMLIAMLYESGCRIGELASLSLRNISFDTYGAVIIVDGKTGQRRVRLISSVPYISEWLCQHPGRGNPDSPLFTDLLKRSNKMISYRTINKVLRVYAKKTGILKRVNPHSFRHARATHLANSLTEAQMKSYFGWVQGSDMASIYVHLSGKDVDDALLRINGVVIAEEDKPKNDAMKPKTCPRCSTINPATGKFCNKCGMPLDMKTAIELETETKEMNDTMSLIMKVPGAKEFFDKALKEIKAGVQHE